jgi:putative transposase
MRNPVPNRKMIKHQKAHFITICTYNRQNLFGQVKNGKMRLNSAGKIIKYCWLDQPKLHNELILDEFVIMPNHLHALVFIQNPNLLKNDLSLISASSDSSQKIFQIMHEFKTCSSLLIASLENIEPNLIWQKNYTQNIVQNDYELNYTRQYIVNNAFSWDLDPENMAKEVIL